MSVSLIVNRPESNIFVVLGDKFHEGSYIYILKFSEAVWCSLSLLVNRPESNMFVVPGFLRYIPLRKLYLYLEVFISCVVLSFVVRQGPPVALADFL